MLGALVAAKTAKQRPTARVERPNGSALNQRASILSQDLQSGLHNYLYDFWPASRLLRLSIHLLI